MNVPTKDAAIRLLDESSHMNPGKWVDHSRVAAQAASLIAAETPGMDADTAYVVGLLHDIGRRFGVSNMKHVTDGYNFLNGLGYADAARICYSHSFHTQNHTEYFGSNDCDSDDFVKLCDYLQHCEYDDYDRLIQLCDALALPEGLCLIEKRMIDVGLRHGFHDCAVNKIKKIFELKQYFDDKTGKNIYSLLPGIVETTFGFAIKY